MKNKMMPLLLMTFFLGTLFSSEAKLQAKPFPSGAVLIAKWKTHKLVSNVNFSPVAQMLVWITREETKPSGNLIYSIHCSHYHSGKEAWNLRLRSEGSNLVFSPDEKTLAYISGDEHIENDTTFIRLLDAATGHLKHTIAAAHTYKLTGGLAFSPDGKTLAYGSFNEKRNETGSPYDMAIVCIDVKKRKPKRALHGLRWGHVTDIAFSPNGRLIAATTFAGDAGIGELAIWRRSGKLLNYCGEGDWLGVDFLNNRRLLAGKTLITYNSRRFTSREFPQKSTEPDFIYAASRRFPVAMILKNTGFEKYNFEAWQVRPRRKIFALALHGYDFHTATSASGNVFALAHNSEIKVWRVTGKFK